MILNLSTLKQMVFDDLESVDPETVFDHLKSCDPETDGLLGI